MTSNELVERSIALLNRQSRKHSAYVYALFSGGDDSLTNTLVTSKAERFQAAVHLDTGIGIPETQEFVIKTCRERGWPLKIYRAKDYGQDYDALAKQYGFPGPGAHFRMYTRLKERALDAFVRDHKGHRFQRLILSTGARSAESQRRMGHVKPVRRDGCSVWVNPIHDWQKRDCFDLIETYKVERNPVVELLHMSGECLCGCFAKSDELKEITLWFPKVARHIRALENEVERAGIKACRWGQRPPTTRSTRKKVSELCRRCEL